LIFWCNAPLHWQIPITPNLCYMKRKKKDLINNPHDKLFKATLTHRQEAIALLKGTLPPEIMQGIKQESIKIANSSYISKELRESMSDVVYEAEYEGFPVKIAFIMEHKSFVPEFPFLQFLMYFVSCIQMQVKQKKKNKPLELALPIIIVVYHGEKEWIVKDVWEYFGKVPEGIRGFIPMFEYLLINLKAEDYIKIKERFQSLILRLSFMTMKGVFDRNGYEQSIEMVFDGVEGVFSTESGADFFEQLIKYIFELFELSTDLIKETINKQTKKGGDKIMTIAAKLRKEGRQEGKQEGRQEGKLEGKQEGRQEGKLLDKFEICLTLIENGSDDNFIFKITAISPQHLSALHQLRNEKGDKTREYLESLL